MNYSCVTYNRAKEKSDRGMEAESHFRQFAKITQLFFLRQAKIHMRTLTVYNLLGFCSVYYSKSIYAVAPTGDSYYVKAYLKS